ncbi:hypothetical protein OQA88_1117 [Cercophora sp. LCS_1]
MAYPYEPLPPSTIRLLRLLPAPHIASPLRCDLIHASLPSTTPYEALSYTWGPTTNPATLALSTHPIQTTRNLSLALRHLRHQDIPRTFWIDALCINQSDPLEQAAQVSIMWTIYQHATRVVVWLGPETGDSAVAMDNIAKRDCQTNAAARQAWREKNKGPCGCHAGNFDNYASRAGVLDLLKQAWFTRVWVLQEVAAAKEVVVVCGDRVVDGQDFFEEMTSLGVASISSTLGKWIRTRRHVIGLMDKKGTGVDGELPLLELIERFRGWEATRRVDKLFALLGFSGDAKDAGELKPDYLVDEGDLARRVVKFALPGCEVEDGEGTEVRFRVKGLVLGDVGRSGGLVGAPQHYSFHAADSNVPGAVWNPKVLELFKKSEDGEWDVVLEDERKINDGSAVLLLKGASRPSVVKLHEGEPVVEMLATPEPAKGHQHWLKYMFRGETREKAWPGVLDALSKEQEGWMDFTLTWDPFGRPHPSAIEHYNPSPTDRDVQWDAYIESLRDQYENGQADANEHNCNTITMMHTAYSLHEDAIRAGTSNLTMTLHKAAYNGYTRTIKLLLDAGANVNEMYQGIGTPLHIAASCGHAKVAKALLDAGADVAIPNFGGDTALILAIMSGHAQVGELLFAAGAVPPMFDSMPSESRMIHHAMCGNVAGVQAALEAGVDPNFAEGGVGSGGGTAMHCAAEMGRSQVISVLLQAGADVDPRVSANGKTPLHLAAMNGHTEAVRVLLAAGADVNALTSIGHTPLDEGLRKGNVEASIVLCEAGGYASLHQP